MRINPAAILNLGLLAALIAPPALADAPPAPAPSGRYVSDPAHTSLIWQIDHFGLSHYTARLTGTSAELNWNLEDPTLSEVVVTVDPRSVRTDFPFPDKEDFDAKIATDPAFLAGAPILFKSTAVKRTGDRTGLVTGDLTFRGQTHPVTLDVTYNGSMAEHPVEKFAKIGFSGTTKIRRADWGLTFAAPALGDDVTLRIETEFMPPKAE